MNYKSPIISDNTSLVVHVKSLLHSDGTITYRETTSNSVTPTMCHTANQEDYLLMTALEWAMVISMTFPNLIIKDVHFTDSNFNYNTPYDQIKELLVESKLVYISLQGSMRPIVDPNFNVNEDDISEKYTMKPDHCHTLAACRELSIALVMALQIHERKLPVQHQTPINPKTKRIARFVEIMLKQTEFKSWKSVVNGNHLDDCSELEIGQCKALKKNIADIDLQAGSLPNKPFLVPKRARNVITEMVRSQSKGYNSFTVERK